VILGQKDKEVQNGVLKDVVNVYNVMEVAKKNKDQKEKKH